MVLKYLSQGAGRVVFDFAILLIAVSTVFNFFAWQKLTGIAEQNSRNGVIIKAATGCEDADTPTACKARLAAAQGASAVPYLRAQDCITRRALAQLPPPPRYDVPCQLP